MSEPLQARLLNMAEHIESVMWRDSDVGLANLLREAAAALAGEGSPVSPADDLMLKRMFSEGIDVARSYGDNAFHLYGEQMQRQYERALKRAADPNHPVRPSEKPAPVSPAGAEQEKGTVMEVPRRARLDLMSPAERMIYNAVQGVEALPADVRLTDAVMLLQAARESVADFIDGVDTRRYVASAPAAGEGQALLELYDNWQQDDMPIEVTEGLLKRFAAYVSAAPRRDSDTE